ncbi:hypothetical protein Naga_100004g61 [Nannochloropsis gaditana]|uniref:Uncharacterized protein n=1 Tax=Nannochloropsis gaditana TaxID=72520 RepID=W7U5U5_9STRA|nr:hypothetical protein Naga_100004g61 [Nannochloropsis gaditana]
MGMNSGVYRFLSKSFPLFVPLARTCDMGPSGKNYRGLTTSSVSRENHISSYRMARLDARMNLQSLFKGENYVCDYHEEGEINRRKRSRNRHE